MLTYFRINASFTAKLIGSKHFALRKNADFKHPKAIQQMQ